MKNLTVAPLIAAICFCLHWIQCSVVTIKDRGYVGLIVALHESVPEDESLITNLKTLFAKGSKFLFDSTNGGAYFKEVTIVIPSSWVKRPEYHVLPGYFFGTAHVRVDRPHPEYGNTPYTLQPGGCGEPGQYIHLTPQFVRELFGDTTKAFEKPERRLVHEWAHFRYGVFDEYGFSGNRRYPAFYFENSKIRPTSCMRDIRGWIKSRDGGTCQILRDGKVSKDCIFIPDVSTTEAKVSIMYKPFIASVTEFCDESSDKKHNRKAPTKHNIVCNYASTWSVISGHKDFQGIRSKTDVPYTIDPVFRLIQSPKNQKGRYVLVLDVSGSMTGLPMKLLHQASTRLMEDRIPDGSSFGIVKFSTEAAILHELITVNNVTRDQLSKHLPRYDDNGQTAIGKGILKAIKVLKEGGVSAEGGLIILITDGEENVDPYIAEVIPMILEEKVIINAIAFGTDASEKVERIIQLTGGKWYYSSIENDKPASALDSAFLESVSSQTDIDQQPVQLKNEIFNLQGTIAEKEVRIDSDLGNNTIFTVSSTDISDVNIFLVSPGGTFYNKDRPEYNKNVRTKERIQMRIKDAEEGKWRVSFIQKGKESRAVAFFVTSEARDIGNEPIRLKSWISEKELRFPAHAKIYAELKKGYRAVTGARVVATVDRPKDDRVNIVLRDDGLGADVTSNDGIYTAVFTNFSGNGRYSVTANVANNGQAKIKVAAKYSDAQEISTARDNFKTEPATEFEMTDLILSEDDTMADDDVLELAPDFDRTADAGAFRLDAWKANTDDVIPPGDIEDLVVVHSSENYDINVTKVTLQWTSPGGDLDSGNASSLELWASTDMEQIIEDIHGGFLIKNTDITKGSLKPKPAGVLQKVSVLLPFPNASYTIYFAMKAKDEAGNVSPRHNVAAVHIYIKKIIKQAERLRKTKVLIWWSVVMGIVACLTIFIFSIGIIIKRYMVKKSYTSVCTQQVL